MLKSHKQSVVAGINLIKKSKNIYIASHIHPDGDNIGSLLALGMALNNVKSDVKLVKVDEIPKSFSFLPNIDSIKNHPVDEEIDLFISLDCSDLDRLGPGKNLALKARSILNIDHHITSDNFGDVNIVIPSASSTGEIVYHFIKELGIGIDKDIATCLYVAISTDTGNFMYDNTTSHTHRVVADLLDKNIDLSDVTTNIYQNNSLERTKLLIDALSNLELHFDKRVGIVCITQDMLDRNDASMEDTEGIISFVRNIENIEIACMLKQFDKEEIKLSLRSKKYVDVSEICKGFGGGGHEKAAGCTIFDEINTAKKMVLDSIKKHLR